MYTRKAVCPNVLVCMCVYVCVCVHVGLNLCVCVGVRLCAYALCEYVEETHSCIAMHIQSAGAKPSGRPEMNTYSSL